MNETPMLPVDDIEKRTVSPQLLNPALAILAFLICLGGGCIHFYFSHRFIPLAQLMSIIVTGALFSFLFIRESKAKPTFFVYGVAIALCFAMGLFFIHSIKEDFNGMNLAAMVCAFLVPVLITEAWLAFKGIKPMDMPIWLYNNDIPTESKLAYFDNRQLKVKLVLNNHHRTLKGIVPSALPLGDAIFFLIKRDKEQHGEEWQPAFINEKGEPYEWIFYSDFLGLLKKYFDPYDTVFNNGLKAKQTIIVKRIE